jgi:uroporphyrin-III C-methyltransferase
VITGQLRKLSTDVALAKSGVVTDGNEQDWMRLSLYFKMIKGEMPVAIIQNGTTPEEK